MPGTPVPVRTGRTVGDFLRAILAFLALAVLVIGVPAALAYFIGWPLPRSVPSLDTLRQEISFAVFQKILALAVWVAWAQFAACVLVEAKAAISGVGMPTRIPGAGPSQLLARNLIASLLLATSAAASFIPTVGQLGNGFSEPPKAGPAAVAQQTPGQEAAGGGVERTAERGGGSEAADSAAGEKAERDTKFYRIQPPEGRHHDTLWGISERHLGDGLRYKEIFELNKDRVQPDGSKLTEASLIRPGWIMEMPADARGGELVEMPDEAPVVSPEVRQEIRDYQRTGDQLTGGGGQDGGAAAEQPGRQAPAAHEAQQQEAAPDAAPSDSRGPAADAAAPGADEAPAGGGSAVPGTGGASADAVATSGSPSFGLPEALLGAPLLAAGLLGALGRRRRHALWRSMAGGLRRGVANEFEPPAGAATDARDALLVGADPEAVRFLDRSLRGLSRALSADNRPLPAVYAAWLGDRDLHLQLAAEAPPPPAPWKLGQSPTFWTIDRTDAEVYDEDRGAAAPYPGLVSLGTREGVRLLLNLESLPGLVSVTGPAEYRTAVLASAAAELATSGWSDRMTVTLVGFGAELPTLAPTRMRHLADVAGLLEVMEAETELRRGQLHGAGHSSVLTGRVGPARGQQWAPHLVLLDAEPTQEQGERLAELAADSDSLGIGYVVGTEQEDLRGAVWQFDVQSNGKLAAPLMGLELDAQLLPEAQRAAVVELFTSTDADGTDPDTAATDRAAQAGPRFSIDLSEHGRPAVYARLLGQYEVVGLDEPEGARSPLLYEALALLLLHREGVHPRVLASALWPRGVTEDVRDALIERLGTWLGTSTGGAALLSCDDTGRLLLAPSVVCDWDVLRTLHHEARAGDSAVERPSATRRQRLKEALDLARGPLLAGRPEGRYGWLAHEIVDAQHPVIVADVGLALAAEYLAADKPRRAAHAVRTALATAPGDERLWNELLRTASATGDEAQLATSAQWLLETNRRLHGPGRGLPSRTEALLDELLPTWRSHTTANAG
ncbi:hypothetical protein JJV70_03430 [Streptomyces sp. JJ66]|uniref:LysM peptidoglycan-binding domain-containing protein n=1 Tax=Streptomyces sp. JJ66 TaxID=2803843 RepID=UPI001C5952C3|nr:hypothetical protein [Streptomyces sp. JJ66]MBW1601169.1 hypothetical protein [Streptomyces sp. JJ66]